MPVPRRVLSARRRALEDDVIVFGCQKVRRSLGGWLVVIVITPCSSFSFHLCICRRSVPLLLASNLLQTIKFLSVQFVEFRVDVLGQGTVSERVTNCLKAQVQGEKGEETYI